MFGLVKREDLRRLEGVVQELCPHKVLLTGDMTPYVFECQLCGKPFSEKLERSKVLRMMLSDK
ncbi:unnamed protein product [marine sediment metagenome]|uniref:Uncharacterized protein n=1 Tax=marine sediment metagenome TaxID=412755 RepID=X0URH3_9ZZZZ